VSATTATIIGAILAGTFGIAGVLVGLFAERFLRSRGEVSVDTEPMRWTFRYATREPAQEWRRSMTGLGPLGLGDVAQATRVEYQFGADFYNGRDLPSGLRAFEVLFHHPHDQPMRANPQDGRTWRTQEVGETIGSRMDPLKVLNLPPKQLVSLEVRGAVPDPTRMEGCERVELRAVFPDGAAFSHELARIDPDVVLAG
jgi:hypothetical protein